MYNKKLFEICRDVACEFRKGEQVTTKKVGDITVHDVYMMPHISEAPPEYELVDMWFIMVGVDKAKAEARREEFIALLDPKDFFADGPSYITIGALVGSQDLALIVMAVGKVLGLWKIVTPDVIIPPNPENMEKLNQLAGMGFIMTTGYNPERAEHIPS